jgi:ABC-2 type transport system ATP-binding protein
LIEVRQVTKRYGSLTVLEDVSLTVADGTVYGLVGANGAGKTTLLKTISGVFRPDAGAVLFGGAPLGAGRGGQRPFIVTDEPYVLPQATPLQMARFYRGYYPDWSRRVFVDLLDLLGLGLKAKIGGFSKGMQRQAVLALALASGAPCLLLDESFDGLDLAKRNLFKTLFRVYAARRGATVVLSSHNLRELEGAVDFVGMLEGKHLIFDLSVEDLRSRYRKYRVPLGRGAAAHGASDGGAAPPAAGLTARLTALLAQSPAVRWFHHDPDGFVFVADAAAGDLLGELAALGAPRPRVSAATLEEIFLNDKQAATADLEAIFA